MMSKLTSLVIGTLIGMFASCSSGNKPEKAENTQPKQKQNQPASATVDYLAYVPSIAKLETFDQGRFLETETAFFIDTNLLVCRLSPVVEANEALITPWDATEKIKVNGFVAVDRINDLVLLNVSGPGRPGIPIETSLVPNQSISIYLTKPQGNTLPLHNGKVSSYGNVGGGLRYQVSNQFRTQSYGTPVFCQGLCIGLGYAELIDYENQNLVIPSTLISELRAKAATSVQPLSQLKSQTDRATGEANKRIKGLLIETDMGNIKIRLYNETPEYRDNFIALVKENYFDSLLVHRVIKGFCVQSGAADTRYAGTDDIVGWKGPGYTLPAHLIPGLFHRRGVIGSPRKPDRGNTKKRSDGSQFYIVTGRTYNDTELNDISAETGYQFTPAQRQVYKTTGGAPHIDGSYTIFGEVTAGMDVADRINAVEVNPDYRPLRDIRVRRISIIK